MRVGFIGVGHWHTPLYLQPLLGLSGVRVVAISDPDREVAERYGRELGCVAASGPAAVAATRPDLVFVLGRHVDMADAVAMLIENGIAFVVEKPAGLSEAAVHRLAVAARDKGVFNAVPLVFRSSGFMRRLAECAADEPVLYADFKFVAGLPNRYYQSGCAWIFDRRLSGGGTLLNLGVHFIDLFQRLTSVTETMLVDAAFANLQENGDVEDYSAITLRNRDSICRVETAYLYPAPIGVFDMHFCVRTASHYVRTTTPGMIEISDIAGRRKIVEGTTTNMPIYPHFVAEVVKQVRTGAPPLADLSDMTNVMRLVDHAYAAAGQI